MHTVRMSMLPGYADCAKRAFAKQFPALVASKGFELNKILPSVGAAVGTATHILMAEIMRGSKSIDPTPAFEKFIDEIKSGCTWDETTETVDDAKRQIVNLAKAFLPVARVIQPEAEAVELRLKIQLPEYPGFEFSGQPDVIRRTKKLDDWKTGKIERNYFLQLGGYGWISRKLGYEITGAEQHFAKRLKNTVPIVRTYKVDVDVAAQAAEAQIDRIVGDVGAFEETGNPLEIHENPMSQMCTLTHCPAFGTRFCASWKDERNVVEWRSTQ